MPWTPLLDGPLAEAALGAVRDVACALAAAPHPTASPADRATFWAYASHVIDEPFAQVAYDAAIDDLVAELRGGARHLALYGGLAGTGWTLCHVLDDADDANDALAAIDEVLAGALAAEVWPGAHDLVEGLVGLGVYFLERIARAPAPAARDGLARVVAHLDAAAVWTEHGATWHTSPALLPPFLTAEWPDGFFDVGLAHGAPGMIAMLDRAARIADAPALAYPLCEEALRWVTHQRRAGDPDGRGRFPTKLGPGPNPGPGPGPGRSRAAWCYGDPGIAAALWSASPELARETALESARRPAETCQVRDAGLCHGAAGLAHLFNRFYQATREPALAAAARDWFARALAMRRPAGPDGPAEPAAIGGFVAHQGRVDDALDLVPDGSLLEGAIGIGLALIAAVAPAEPRWDRLLLCDLPLHAGE